MVNVKRKFGAVLSQTCPHYIEGRLFFLVIIIHIGHSSPICILKLKAVKKIKLYKLNKMFRGSAAS